VAGRLLLRATPSLVYFAGRPLNWQCAFHAATGLPCPTCGLTRSVVMSLHGDWALAWNIAPAGPVAVAGLTIFALAMLALAFVQWVGAETLTLSASRWIRKSALAYAAAATVIWLGGWAVSLQSSLAAR
jgi:hypothetical protein